LLTDDSFSGIPSSPDNGSVEVGGERENTDGGENDAITKLPESTSIAIHRMIGSTGTVKRAVDSKPVLDHVVPELNTCVKKSPTELAHLVGRT